MSGDESGQSPQLRAQPVQRPCSWIPRPMWQEQSQARWGVRSEVHGEENPRDEGFTDLGGCSGFTLKAQETTGRFGLAVF